MNEEKSVVVLSEQEKEDDVIREVCLKVKSVTSRQVRATLVFFTPHYKAYILGERLRQLLLPRRIWGAEVPCLVFEGRVVERGVVVCCFIQNEIEVGLYTNNENWERFEMVLRKFILHLKGEKNFVLCWLSSDVDVSCYIDKMELVKERVSNVLGVGFRREYGFQPCCIVDSRIGKGVVIAFWKGEREVLLHRISGFLPLSGEFTITRVSKKGDIILEINNKPASSLYKHYLGEKFVLFKKMGLFEYYPLGIEVKGGYKLISIVDIMDDGSFITLGRVKEGQKGKIMIATAKTLMEATHREVQHIKENFSPQLVIMMVPLVRRNILGRKVVKEIEIVKEGLGERIKLIGLYCDYSIFPFPQTGEYTVEMGSLSFLLVR